MATDVSPGSSIPTGPSVAVPDLPAPGMRASIPRPSALRMALSPNNVLNQFGGQCGVRLCTPGAGIVHHRRHAIARALTKPDISRYYSLKYLVREVLPDLVYHLV